MHNTSKQVLVKRFETTGPEEFYTSLVRYGATRVEEKGREKQTSPELELLNYSNQFLQIFRRENKDIYREISFCFRRAAHTTYRLMLANKIIKKSSKFLNLVE